MQACIEMVVERTKVAPAVDALYDDEGDDEDDVQGDFKYRRHYSSVISTINKYNKVFNCTICQNKYNDTLRNEFQKQRDYYMIVYLQLAYRLSSKYVNYKYTT